MKKFTFIAFCWLVTASTVFAASALAGVSVTIEMKGQATPPTLVVHQVEKDGSSRILDKVSEDYVAALPHFLEYLDANIKKYSKELPSTQMSALAVVYSYPDNLEINILSNKREKIVKKIQPDDMLHKLRIRSAVLMSNFVKDQEADDISSNVIVGFELFPQGLDYTGMNIVPEYDLRKGSWTLEIKIGNGQRILIIKTEIFQEILNIAAFGEKMKAAIELAVVEGINIMRNDGILELMRIPFGLQTYFNTIWQHMVPNAINAQVEAGVVCSCRQNNDASPVAQDQPCVFRINPSHQTCASAASQYGCSCP